MTDEITKSLLRPLRYPNTGTPKPAGSCVGMAVAGGRVGCGGGEVCAGAEVAGTQAATITVRTKPMINKRVSFIIVTLLAV